MSFRNKNTGVIETPIEKLADQYTSRPELWEAVTPGEKASKPTTKKQGDNGPSYKELKEIATAMGLEFPSNVKKDTLIEIIRTAQEEQGQDEDQATDKE